MSVTEAFAELVGSLDQRTPEVDVLVAAGEALALEIDMAQVADNNGKTKSASAAATALRALMVDLIAKGRAGVADADGADGDWSAPAAVADLAEVRNAKKPGARDARRGSGAGRSSAS